MFFNVFPVPYIFHSHFPWLHPIFPNAISWLRAPLTDLVGDSWNSFLSRTSHQFNYKTNLIFVFIFVPIARLLCPIFHLRSLHKVHFLSPPVQFSTPSLSTFSEPIIKVAHWSTRIFWSEWTHRIQLGLLKCLNFNPPAPFSSRIISFSLFPSDRNFVSRMVAKFHQPTISGPGQFADKGLD